MIIKNKEEENKIITAGKINLECLYYLESLVDVGISSYEVDQKAFEYYKSHGVKPAFLGIYGYPATINFMINDQVVHNIPSKDQIVKEGDLVSIDTGCIYEGYYGDNALSFAVGKVSQEDQKLLDIAKLSVKVGCDQAISGNRIGDIGYAEQTVIELAGFSVVKKYVGHEIGRNLHERIKVPAFGERGTGEVLLENLVLAIENQVTNGEDEVYTDEENGWSVYTKDGSDAVTFESMVIVKKEKPFIISL